MTPRANPGFASQKTAALVLLMAVVAIGFILQMVVLPHDAQAVRSPRPAAREDAPGPGPAAADAPQASPSDASYARGREAENSRAVAASPARPAPQARLQAAGPDAALMTAQVASPRPASASDPAAGRPAHRAARTLDAQQQAVTEPAGQPRPGAGRDAAGGWTAVPQTPDPGPAPAPPGMPDAPIDPVEPALPDADPEAGQEETPDPDSGGIQMVVLGPAAARGGDQVTYAISLEAGRNIAHAPIRIGYDPQVLRFVEAQEGPLMSSDGAATQFLAKEEAGEGLVDIAISRMPPARGMTGSGILCTVTFVAQDAGESPVLIAGSRLLSPSGRRIAFRGNDAHVAVRH